MPPPPSRTAPSPAKPAPGRFAIAPRQRVKRAPVVLVNAVEGFGKTTIGANAPSPLILMSGNETGYDTLLGHGLVPQVPAAVVESWPDTLAWVRQLADDLQGVQTLVLDALGGFEQMCREHVCQRDFKGDWSDGGFNSYGKGYDATAREWKLLIQALEQLRDNRGVTVLMLGHVKIEAFKNPTGTDYNRYASDVHKSVWALTAKFCDAVLFGTFYQSVDVGRTEQKKNEADKKGKVVGVASRVIVTQRRDGFDAKNRFGMPDEIWLDANAAGMYAEIWQHIDKETQS